ncbi:hypothetical protein [Rhizobium sp. Root482]|uniref:hypothetical protein n=1 Tax=Rhizobium sp. Root482 TaxID=1736543 RepID=UPI0006F9CBF7|nr:hypothetical protein [Rhizobium sp. Root482]KQY14413.1 hypothetical protein ASD31_09090 [Rhizobium sp. Root482]
MISLQTWLLAFCFGAFIWFLGSQSGPVAAAALVGFFTVANGRHGEIKIAELEKRLEDLSWRLRDVMKDE